MTQEWWLSMVGVISLGTTIQIILISWDLHHYKICFAKVRLPHVLEAHLGTLFGVPWRLMLNPAVMAKKAAEQNSGNICFVTLHR